MEIRLRQRLIGGFVLIALVIIFIPFIFKEFFTTRGTALVAPTHIPLAPAESDFKQTVIVLPNKQGEEQIITLNKDTNGDINAHASKSVADDSSAIKPVEFKPIGAVTQEKLTSVGKAWIIEVGTFAHIDYARTLQKQLQRRGFTAYLHTNRSGNGSDLTQVLIGPEINRETAEILLLRLKKEMHLTGVILAFDPLINDLR